MLRARAPQEKPQWGVCAPWQRTATRESPCAATKTQCGQKENSLGIISLQVLSFIFLVLYNKSLKCCLYSMSLTVISQLSPEPTPHRGPLWLHGNCSSQDLHDLHVVTPNGRCSVLTVLHLSAAVTLVLAFQDITHSTFYSYHSRLSIQSPVLVPDSPPFSKCCSALGLHFQPLLFLISTHSSEDPIHYPARLLASNTIHTYNGNSPIYTCNLIFFQKLGLQIRLLDVHLKV